MIEATPIDLFDQPEEQMEYFNIPGINSKWVIENAKAGCNCPLCGGRVKIYPRQINSEMAKVLVLLYRHFTKYPKSRPVHVDSFLTKVCGVSRPKGNNHSLLVHWGLLERIGVRESRAGQKRDGYYIITKTGAEFVEKQICVPKYLFFYQNIPIGESPDHIFINDVRKFSLDDLMDGKPFDSVEFV